MNRRLVLAAASVGMFATNLDFFALNLAIPGMAGTAHDAGFIFLAASLMQGGGGAAVGLARGAIQGAAPDGRGDRGEAVSSDRAGEASGVSLAIVIGAAGLCVAIASALIESLSTGGTGEGQAIEDILTTLAIASVVLAIPLALLARSRAPADGDPA